MPDKDLLCQIFLQRETLFSDLFGDFRGSYIPEMPWFKSMSSNILLTFGITNKKPIRDRWVPFVAILAPLACILLQVNSQRWFGGYRFSYELLLVNAALTYAGLCLLIKRTSQTS